MVPKGGQNVAKISTQGDLPYLSLGSPHTQTIKAWESLMLQSTGIYFAITWRLKGYYLTNL